MIAIDTNVLLRYVLQDDVDQARRATRLFTTSDSILIHNVVLTEAVWVLTGPKYRLSRGDVVLFVESLIEEPNVRFEDNQVVWQSIQLFKRAPRRQGKQADFARVCFCTRKRQQASEALDSARAKAGTVLNFIPAFSYFSTEAITCIVIST